MTAAHRDIIRRHSRPLEPLPTGQKERIEEQRGLRAVLFDIYGTMFISASGEVGTADDGGRGDAFTAALTAVGITETCGGDRGVEQLNKTILAHQDEARAEGVDYPEVDILAVWRDVLSKLGLDECSKPGSAARGDAVNVERLAVEYEVRTNPVWPMPHVAECVKHLLHAGLELGIVSNAQFFTLELFPALLMQTADELGFDEQLQFYSYQYRRAKPSVYLYELARDSLASRGVKPDEILYVGNDVLNDVAPAAQLGFRTALFAGDARSLRLRQRDPRTDGVLPDLVLTDLTALIDCIKT